METAIPIFCANVLMFFNLSRLFCIFAVVSNQILQCGDKTLPSLIQKIHHFLRLAKNFLNALRMFTQWICDMYLFYSSPPRAFPIASTASVLAFSAMSMGVSETLTVPLP